MTTPLYFLRCKQAGLTVEDLKELTEGMVYDMFEEINRDKEEWPDLATAEDIAKM